MSNIVYSLPLQQSSKFICWLLFCLGLLMATELSAQTSKGSVQGKVYNAAGESLSFANVVLDSLQQGTATTENGNYTLSNLNPGTYLIRARAIGYKEKAMRVQVRANNTTTANFYLQENEHSLSEVNVSVRQQKTEAQQIEELAFAVDSKLTTEYKNITRDVNGVLNQMQGIRVRQTGGLGSRFDLSLNGLSGKQVRYFVDGIPVDELGSTYSLNNLSVNLVERVDVYKGVVPVALGADALGGAINVVTNQATESYLDASYSIGSFNTHRAAVSARHRFSGNGLTVAASGFYNYSDNNYRMQSMPVFIDKKEQLRDIRRFHDSFKSTMGRAEAGFTKVRWADELLIGFAAAEQVQDIQSGVYGTPVGEATEDEQNNTFTFSFRKSGMASGKLEARFFSLYNHINSTSIDTSSNRYDWSGAIIRTEDNNLGELVREKTIFDYEQRHFLNRFFASYELHQQHRLNMNVLSSHIRRQGENRLNIKDNEPFRSPNTLQKTVAGLEYDANLLDERLSVVLGAKLYQFDMLTRNAVQFADNSFSIEDIEKDLTEFGYSAAARFFLLDDFYVKASYEKGYRLPQPHEIFGDGLRILANPELRPESSHNLNLGLSFRRKLGQHVLRAETNTYLREVSDYVFMQQAGKFSQYSNILDVRVYGLEGELSYTLGQRLSVQANATWQRVLNNQKYVAGTTTESRVYQDAMPNTPYLFANTQIRYNFKPLFGRIEFSAYHTANYVHEFYLNYPSISRADTKNIIPTQFINSAGVSFSSPGKRYNASFEVTNLLDAEAYDNFKLQKQGRAFAVKLRYFFSKTNTTDYTLPSN